MIRIIIYSIGILTSFYGQTLIMAEQKSKKVELYAGISGGKKLPFKPHTPISEEKVKLLKTYFKAGYDCEGSLFRLTKYIDGKVFTVQTIAYDGDDISEVVIRDADDNIIREKTYR